MNRMLAGRTPPLDKACGTDDDDTYEGMPHACQNTIQSVAAAPMLVP